MSASTYASAVINIVNHNFGNLAATTDAGGLRTIEQVEFLQGSQNLRGTKSHDNPRFPMTIFEKSHGILRIFIFV